MARMGWFRPEDVNNDSDSDDDDDDEEMDLAEKSQEPSQYFAKQITTEEYAVQKKEYTKMQLDNLINSAAYQRRLNTCGSCWSCWLEGQWSSTCMECGGFALKRPCPICRGLCQNIWSHSFHEAYWDGECGLEPEERERFMYQYMLEDAGDEDVLDGMEDLSTS